MRRIVEGELNCHNAKANLAAIIIQRKQGIHNAVKADVNQTQNYRWRDYS